MPARKSSLKWLIGWTNLQSLAAIITAIVAIIATVWNIRSTNELYEKERKIDWLKVVVFTIIQKGQIDDNKNQNGLTFDEIKERYKKILEGDYTVYRQYNLSRDDLDDTKLNKILLDLLQHGQIRFNFGKAYSIPLESFNPRGDRKQNEIDITYEIINVLTAHKGIYTAEELRLQINKRFQSDIEGYNYAINILLAERIIIADYDKGNKSRRVLYTSANCPNCPFVEIPPAAPLVPPIPQKGQPENKGGSDSMSCCGQPNTSK